MQTLIDLGIIILIMFAGIVILWLVGVIAELFTHIVNRKSDKRRLDGILHYLDSIDKKIDKLESQNKS